MRAIRLLDWGRVRFKSRLGPTGPASKNHVPSKGCVSNRVTHRTRGSSKSSQDCPSLGTVRPPSRKKDRKLVCSVDTWEWLAVEQGQVLCFRKMAVGTSREGLGRLQDPACLTGRSLSCLQRNLSSSLCSGCLSWLGDYPQKASTVGEPSPSRK